jgi:hypothetical protein
MTCAAIRDWLLNADHPGRPIPAVAAHLHTCPACRDYADRLERLEADYRTAPIPDFATAARAAFLDKLAVPSPTPVAALRRWVLPPRWVLAASVLFLVGVGMFVFWPAPQAQAASDVVDRLIDWNLDLAEAGPLTERDRVYAERRDAFAAELGRTGLAPADRELADVLVANAVWLAGNDDPVEEAERLNLIADRLLERMQSAAGGGDETALGRHAQNYRKVTEHGVARSVEKAKTKAEIKEAKRLEKLTAREMERVRALEALLETTPNPTKKEIRQALGQGANKPKRKQPARVGAADDGE